MILLTFEVSCVIVIISLNYNSVADCGLFSPNNYDILRVGRLTDMLPSHEAIKYNPERLRPDNHPRVWNAINHKLESESLSLPPGYVFVLSLSTWSETHYFLVTLHHTNLLSQALDPVLDFIQSHVLTGSGHLYLTNMPSHIGMQIMLAHGQRAGSTRSCGSSLFPVKTDQSHFNVISPPDMPIPTGIQLLQMVQWIALSLFY